MSTSLRICSVFPGFSSVKFGPKNGALRKGPGPGFHGSRSYRETMNAECKLSNGGREVVGRYLRITVFQRTLCSAPFRVSSQKGSGCRGVTDNLRECSSNPEARGVKVLRVSYTLTQSGPRLWRLDRQDATEKAQKTAEKGPEGRGWHSMTCKPCLCNWRAQGRKNTPRHCGDFPSVLFERCKNSNI